jgi:hypothetical protein
VFHVEANLVIGDDGAWHWDRTSSEDLSPPVCTPPTRRRRQLVAYGGYAAFSSSPPAILLVVAPDILNVAPQRGKTA